MVMTASLRDEIDEWLPELIETRRDFHRHPELGFEETRTSSIVAERLRAIGFEDVRAGIAVTGVKAVLRGGRPGKTLLLRADMDALPIEEENEVEYCSTVKGTMHACGHDGHTAILLSAARMLYARRDEIPGTIVFCFQPAEEGRGGARRMIEDGVLEDPEVDAAIGLHLLSDFPVGTAVVVDGPTMSGSDRFNVKIQGSGGHGAMPHNTVDALLIAAEVVTTLQTLVSREVDPQKPAVISVGTLHAGGTAANIIADSATLSGTVRWFDADVGDQLARRVPEIIQGIAAALRGSAEVEYRRGSRPTVNDPAVAALVREAAAEVIGAENVWTGPPLMASEDFSEFTHRVPSTFFFVGTRDEATGKTFQHHHPRFDIDERSLPLAVEMMTRAALHWLESNASG
ncbi:MAG TPA: amidohydrolase [Thermomicrobiales bacterium]|nr:amidohydrolase [Thermomicrobiales bacterium]